LDKEHFSCRGMEVRRAYLLDGEKRTAKETCSALTTHLSWGSFIAFVFFEFGISIAQVAHADTDGKIMIS
jgi:hypothetical protein